MYTVDEQGRRIASAEPMDSLREMICTRMTDGVVQFPQGTGSAFLDIGKVIQFRNKLKEEGKHVTFGDIYVKAAACALQETRKVNAARIDGKIVMYDSINIGMMTYFNDVLLEPVMVDADKKDVLEISEEFSKIYGYLKKGRLMRVPLEGATFSISNMGMSTMDFATPLISPPNAAILGIGRVFPMAGFDENGHVIKKNMAGFSLSVDHGLIDGMVVAAFLQSIDKVLQDPEEYMFKKG